MAYFSGESSASSVFFPYRMVMNTPAAVPKIGKHPEQQGFVLIP